MYTYTQESKTRFLSPERSAHKEGAFGEDPTTIPELCVKIARNAASYYRVTSSESAHLSEPVSSVKWGRGHLPVRAVVRTKVYYIGKAGLGEWDTMNC